MRFTLIFSFFWIIVFDSNARDTMVLDILNSPTPIISIMDDNQGNVFIHTKRIIYKFEQNQWKFFKNCSPEDREMIFENGEVTFIDHSKPEAQQKLRDYLEKIEKHKIWLPFLKSADQADYVFMAKDKVENIWVSTGSNLYKLKIKDTYTVLYENKSIRGIDTLDGKLLVNTYQGIYMDNHRIWPEILYSHGNYLKTSDSSGIMIGDNMYHIEKDKIQFLYDIPKPYYGLSLSKSIIYKGKIWIGSNRGLFELDGKRIIHTGFNTVIHNLEIVDEKLIASTKMGLFYLKGKQWMPMNNFPRIHFNSLKKINHFYFGMSESGLYVSTSFGGRAALKWNKVMECYGICMDEKNNLWLSTSNGLLRFNNKCSSFEYHFRNIEFNKRSIFFNSPYLYAGSVKGLYKINTRSFNDLKNEFQAEFSFFLNICLGVALSCIFLKMIPHLYK